MQVKDYQMGILGYQEFLIPLCEINIIMHLSFDMILSGLPWNNCSQQTDASLNKHMLVSSQI